MTDADPDHEETRPAAPAVAGCNHLFGGLHGPCPHLPAPESSTCVWHNPLVDKGDAYVARLVAQAARVARGDLAEAHLVGVQAPGINLAHANLSRADLRDAVLDGARLSGANLAGSRLRRASLKRADLSGADLRGADLAGSNLGGADLADVRFEGAVLDGTVLKGASATGADFTGADLRSLRWSRRSRLSGATGLPEDLAAAVAGPEPAEDDPSADESRVWERAAAHPSALRPAAVAASDLVAPPGPNGPPVPSRTRRGPWLAVAAVAAVLAIAGTAVGAWGLRAAAAVPQDTVRLAAELAASTRQAEANLAEVRRLQAALAAAEEAQTAGRTAVARASDEASMRRAEAEDARRRLSTAEADVARLRDADDRAALMALRLADAQRLGREQAEQLRRQERVGGILADGVRHLRSENTRLDAVVGERVAQERRADQLTAELATVRQEVEALRTERAALAARERRLSEDLTASNTVIQGYLARVADANLGSVLGDEAAQQPLLPVKAGTPIALIGDYMVSLRLDPADGGGVAARLVVQRPAAAANPNISVVLYDASRRPLRRFGFGFPHVDRGAPFTSANAQIACDEFPAFARVIVSPAATLPLGAR